MASKNKRVFEPVPMSQIERAKANLAGAEAALEAKRSSTRYASLVWETAHVEQARRNLAIIERRLAKAAQ